ncbi:hypothetical protein [Bradyrhizobium sp. SSUT77]|nr:hypothetical protein [Bradyrhizobium sp. SSUT77]MDH2345507.1 hypothetical protein [Bradyrhizobium sp. SSUT77]
MKFNGSFLQKCGVIRLAQLLVEFNDIAGTIDFANAVVKSF